MSGGLLEAVRGMRVVDPDLGVKSLLVKLKERASQTVWAELSSLFRSSEGSPCERDGEGRFQRLTRPVMIPIPVHGFRKAK